MKPTIQKRIADVMLFVIVMLIVWGAPTFYDWQQQRNEHQRQEIIKAHVQYEYLQREAVQKQKKIIDQRNRIVTLEHKVKAAEQELNRLKRQKLELSGRSRSAFPDVKGPYSMVATWYDLGGGINGSGITATGSRPIDGMTIAVDPNIIPLGSKILVKFRDGHTHEYTAQDTGSAIVGNRIDIFDSNPTECMDNGIQDVTVYILHG